MKVLVIGSGGREHALVWKLAQSPHVTGMWCAPGNAGIAAERLAKTQEPVALVKIAADNLAALQAFAREQKPDLTVVGPDNPLAMGIVDLFQQQGLTIWGPNQKAAQFESSKVFSQDFMRRHGIPTATAEAFTDPIAAKRFVQLLGGRCAVKADGLALGKGVIVCQNAREAELAIDDLLVKKAFGTASERIVIQEYLEGQEVSIHALCDGQTALLFPTAQDHKRIWEGDMGPNTGGMGTYSPTPFLNSEQMQGVYQRIIQPWLKGCAQEGIDYRGILYPGLILTVDGPKVLEFNARFGDPETQVYLTRLENDLAELLWASANGKLAGLQLRWSTDTAVCVVMASAGYPGSYVKGNEIIGLSELAKLANIKVFHAGTAQEAGKTVTSGGRVLGVTAWAENLAAARKVAYQAVDKIKFDGAQFRRDIGAKALG